MSRSLDGYLILGWEVDNELEELEDDGEARQQMAEEKIKSVSKELGLGKWSHGPVWFWSAYYPCDRMWVGLRVANGSWLDSKEDIHEFVRRMSENADKYEKLAYEIYEIVMDRPADTPPKILEIATEG